jgi:hypothetical protein
LRGLGQNPSNKKLATTSLKTFLEKPLRDKTKDKGKKKCNTGKQQQTL